MQKLSLDALARELVGQAAGGEKPGDSRVSRTVVGGHEKALRQTVIALAKDAALAEHASPGEATVFVLRGRVTLAAGGESWEGREGDLIIVPDAPHSLTALADSAVLLTVVKHPLSSTRYRAGAAPPKHALPAAGPMPAGPWVTPAGSAGHSRKRRTGGVGAPRWARCGWHSSGSPDTARQQAGRPPNRVACVPAEANESGES